MPAESNKTRTSLPNLLLFYNLAQFAAMPLLLPALTAVCLCRKKYRGQFLSRMGRMPVSISRRKTGRRIWIHAMSLGEFNAARPLVTALMERYPQADIMLSASTASGIAALDHSRLSIHGHSITLPFDLFPVVRHVIGKTRPDCFVLVETDVWPNFLWSLRKQGIPALLVNGSISIAAARRLKRIPGAGQFIYGPFNLLAMQSEDDAERITRLKLQPEPRVMNCGNLKFDCRPCRITSAERQELLRLTGFPGEAGIITAGSTHPGEEEMLLKAFTRLKARIPEARLILAPRTVSRASEIAKMARQMGLLVSLRSSVSTDSAKGRDCHLFILDTLGELQKFYSLAHMAFVGGSLVPVGGHNLLEPAALGIPVLFGPFMESFRQVAEILADAGAGFQVRDALDMEKRFGLFIRDRKARERAARAASRLMDANKDITGRYINAMAPFLERNPGQ